MFELLFGARIKRTRYLVLLMFAFPAFLTGCGEGPNAEFVSHERTKNLMPAATNAIEETLEKHFGQPNSLVAWNAFPVDYGSLESTVTAAEEAGEGKQKLTLELDEDPDFELVGSSVQFLRENEDGDEFPEFLRVTAYDAEKKQITVAGTAFPEADSEISLGGHKLKYGKDRYMKHCLHCHGVSGDGSGPTGKYLNPRPRDFRLGLFKFKSTGYSDKPSRDDIAHTIKEGIPGTYMPSFKLLPEEEVVGIVEYVRWLTIRGELEKRLVDGMESDFSQSSFDERTSEDGGETAEEVNQELTDFLAEDYPLEITDHSEFLLDKWEAADEEESVVSPSAPRVKDDAASRERGRKFYVSAKCITCHGPQGYGDGSETETYKKNPLTNAEYPEPGLYDSWGLKIKPRDLRAGQFRGGRRPIDVFRRIAAGIPGTPMQGFRSSLKDEEIWDVVNYVLHMPHEDPKASLPTAASTK